MTFERGWRAREDVVWCLRRPGEVRTLCNLLVDMKGVQGSFFDTDLGPSNPSTQCPQCAGKARELEESR